MRRMVALALLLALLLSACAPQEMPATEPSNEAPTEPPTVGQTEQDKTLSLIYYPQYGLNPFTCTATLNRALFSLLYESLFAVSSSFRAEPVLCERFETAEGGTLYTLTLCAEARFSDGSPVTAEDVVASLNAARESEIYGGRLDKVRAATAISERELTIEFRCAYENAAVLLDFPVVRQEDVAAQYPVGSGAYRFDAGRLISCENWWQDAVRLPAQETIELHAAEDAEQVRDEFEFGGADLVYCDPNAVGALNFRCDYEVWEVPTTVMHYIGFSMSGFFSDAALRAALGRSVDREALVNDCYGGFARASVLPCSPASDLYDRALAARYGYEENALAEAVRTRAELDLTQQIRIIVCVDDASRVAAAQKIARVCTDAGLNVKLKELSQGDYLTALSRGEYDLYIGQVRLTTDFDLSEFFSSGGSLNYGGIADSALSALCTSARANSGDYVSLCAQLLERASIVPLLFKSYAVYVTRGKITTLTPSVDCIFHNSTTARPLSDADKSHADNPDTSRDNGEMNE